MLLRESILLEFQPAFKTGDFNSSNNWANPDIRPTHLDGNFATWLKRIDNWGKLEFKHTDPEKRFRNKNISRSDFLRALQTNDLLKIYGKFRVEVVDVATLEFIRDYVGMDGKAKEEKIRLHVKLKPELKKGLSWTTSFFN